MPDQDKRVFNARYELHRRIARGGMADVFLARDSLLDRPVAVKVLFPEFATDPTFVQRFRREAQAAANLSHPNIVSVYDWGEEGGTYFIVMEYVEGPSLAQLIRDEGRIEPERAADITADVAAALGFAHRNGVVHRDVKPGNVIISPNGQVKVADFGIARAVSTQENLTQAGTVMGTATYFSPEQARGEAVDPRSDVYSLGVVLYEMLTGRPPFTGDSPVAVAYKHVQETPQPPRARNPRIPGALEAIVLQAMAKDTAERYASAEDLRSDLGRFRQGSPVSAQTVAAAPLAAEPTRAVASPLLDPGATRAIPAAAAGTGATQVLSRQEEHYLDEPPRRTNTAFIVVLVVMLALLAGLLILLATRLGVTDGGGEVAVPNVEGQPQDRARTILEDAGLEVSLRSEENPDVPEGEVFAQDPPAGTVVQEGDTVTITASSGATPVAVPRVVGLRELEADGRLDAVGLVGDFRPEESDDVAAGIVISQDPAEGDMVAPESTVVVRVSSGPDTVPVPPVVNLSQADATNLLTRAGFRTEVRQQNADLPAGTVVATQPGPGTEAPEGSTVVIVVSTGPATTTTEATTTTTTEATTTTTRPTTTITLPRRESTTTTSTSGTD
ncbi:MAG: Stk1 family PASTA domain-containing Ser/Thr kinase [Actinobacteria bacterium]|nr:Stk1 family PASTA domain-containing Ser/Thr kinase [Actinomycetota bacterium]